MHRRDLLSIAVAAFAVPTALVAQTARRVYRIGILDDAGETARQGDFAEIREALHRVGLAEGSTAVFEVRRAQGRSERLNALASELVATKPDIILTPGTPTTRAAMRATSSIPIVFWGAADPVGAGLVASLARPGRNVTGVSIMATQTEQKNLELLHQLAPKAQRIAYLTDTGNQAATLTYSRLEEKARALKLSLQMLDCYGREALEGAFATIRRERVQGLLVAFNGSLLEYKDDIVAFAAREKLLTVYGRAEYVAAGGLISYTVDRKSGRSRTADLVRKILAGAKPAELAVEQISGTRLVVNRKTAQSLGLSIPQAILLRADEVVE
jgi:putative ABC transport system substrate-binding protein